MANPTHVHYIHIHFVILSFILLSGFYVCTGNHQFYQLFTFLGELFAEGETRISILIILITNRDVCSQCTFTLDTISKIVVRLKCENTTLKIASESLDKFKALKGVELYNITIADVQLQSTLSRFANFSNLTHLAFEASELTDENDWELPPNLEIYSVANNGYTSLNVSMCPKIQHVNATNNNLRRVPEFAKPPVPLKTLNLENNPLDDLTVEQLAPFCNLTELKIKLPPSSYLLTNKGACDCILLKKWVTTYNISGASFECMELQNHVNCDLLFTSISLKNLRKHCGDEYKLPDPPSVLWHFTIGGLFFILLFVAAFLTYKFLFRKKSHENSAVKEHGEEEQEGETEDGTAKLTGTHQLGVLPHPV